MTLRDDILDYLRWHGPATATAILREMGSVSRHDARAAYVYRTLIALCRAGAVDRRTVLARMGSRPWTHQYFLADAEDDRE